MKPAAGQWALLPKTTLNLPTKDVNAELARLRNERTGIVEKRSATRRVRAIVLGDGAAGKTTLLQALHGEDVVEGRASRTRGVDRRASHVEETGILRKVMTLDYKDGVLGAHFWDFGGQVIVQATHKFFLRAGCLYLIVIDGRKTQDPNGEAERWLDTVQSFGKMAPVMLIGSKADAQIVRFDQSKLQRKHPSIREFHSVSALKAKVEPYKTAFTRLREDLIAHLERLVGVGERFTTGELGVLRAIEERATVGQDFLSYEAFRILCGNHGLDEANCDELARRLDILGVLIDFPELPTFHEYLLDPRWLTYGVFTLLNDPRATATDGRLSLKTIAAILENPLPEEEARLYTYDPGRIEFVAKAMAAFGLAYRTKDAEECFVLPELLDEQEPKDVVDRRDGLAIRLKFTSFLPLHVLHALIVSESDDIAASAGGKPCVWRYGVMLEPRHGDEATALLVADEQDRTLDMHVSGPDARRYAGALRRLIQRELGDGSREDVQELVRLTPDMRWEAENAPRIGPLQGDVVWMPYRQIEAFERGGYKKFPGPDFVEYSLDKVLAIVPPWDEDREFDVFLSYSSANRAEIRALASALEDAGVRVWFDRSLAGREAFPDRLRARVDASKVTLVLWSDTAAKSSWVRWEAQRAGEKCVHLCLDGFPHDDIPPPYTATNDIIRLSDRERLLKAVKDRLKQPSKSVAPKKTSSSTRAKRGSGRAKTTKKKSP